MADENARPARARTLGSAAADQAPVTDPDRIVQALDLGQRLALARQQRGLTQKQFSELVGKSRATIIQYEQGRLQPPLQQIQKMAEVLEVAPELIAFGRQGITGLGRETASVTSLPEVELDGPEEVVSGGHGLSQNLVDHLGIEPGGARIYVLAEAAPAFELAKGDRIIVNGQKSLTQKNRLYALRTEHGIAVARLLPNLAASSTHLNLNGGHGETAAYDPRDLNVLGVVVGSIQAR